MIVFYCFTKPVKIEFTIGGNEGPIYTSNYEAVESKEEVVAEKIYFAPPSCVQNQIALLRKTYGNETDLIVLPVDAKAVTQLKEYPLDISFENFEDQFERFQGQETINIAFINAMSSGLGDHLIGMAAFDYWYKKLSYYLPNTNIVISFFQINTIRTAEITKQWSDKVNNIYMLPSNLVLLLAQDAYVDLGTFVMHDDFDEKNLFDFYLEAFAVDPTTVPVEEKRIKFDVSEELKMDAKDLLSEFNKENRPLLLVHHSSSSPIRSLDDGRAIKLIEELIAKTDYFIVSARPLEFENERFKDISYCSTSLEKFAAIISQMDGIITVDTSTYHFADAFSVPTVALFTTIEPELRCKYYPYVKGIMLENKDGKLYGKHVLSIDGFEAKKELKYLAKLWDKINVDELLNELNILIDKKKKDNK